MSNHFDQFLGESGLADFPQLLHVSEEKLKRKEACVFLRRGRGDWMLCTSASRQCQSTDGNLNR